MSVACRMFPPGPYWKPSTAPANLPDWVRTAANPFGKAASWNDTTTVLYRIHLDRLIRKDYDYAFVYMGPLTDPEMDDNRDAFLFPERMTIDGVLQYVLIHRPRNPSNFEAGKGHDKPSIMLAAAPTLKDFVTSKARHHFLAAGLFDWEGERIGASWPPIRIGDREWLMQVHGKTYPGFGYSQSFVILKQREGDFPEIRHRCSERLMYARQAWEMPGIFEVPCLFTTGGVVVDDTLIISYGAADQVVGIARVDLQDVVRYVRSFDAQGQRTDL